MIDRSLYGFGQNSLPPPTPLDPPPTSTSNFNSYLIGCRCEGPEDPTGVMTQCHDRGPYQRWSGRVSFSQTLG